MLAIFPSGATTVGRRGPVCMQGAAAAAGDSAVGLGLSMLAEHVKALWFLCNVNLLLTPDLNIVQVLTIVIVVIVVNIVCRQLRTAKAEKIERNETIPTSATSPHSRKRQRSQMALLSFRYSHY